MGSSSSALAMSVTTKLIFPGAPKYDLDFDSYSQRVSTIESHNLQNEKTGESTDHEFEIKPDVNDSLKISSTASEKKKQKIIYFHGNSQNAKHSLDIVIPIFRRLQITIFVMEYPGYGNYSKHYTRSFIDTLKEDCEEFHKQIRKRHKINGSDIYLIGRSIGTGVASYLTSLKQVDCQRLILISPFDSIKHVVNQKVEIYNNYLSLGIGDLFAVGHFDNIKALESYKGDMMVIHGKVDEVIGISHAENLVKKFKETHSQKCDFMKVRYMGHNNIEMNKQILEKIQEFITKGSDKKEYEIQLF